MNTQTDAAALVIAARFAGPPRSGNGGYTAGLLAAQLPTDPHHGVQVTLRMPPPLDLRLLAQPTAEGGLRLLHDGQTVADAEIVEVHIDPVEAVSLAHACEAEQSYAGLRSHPFPTCFTCGPDREPGDGLRLAPGPVPGHRTACTWNPDPSLGGPGGQVRPEFVWAALDCPGGWTADLQDRPMVLGRITAQVDDLPHVGERLVVMGRLLAEEGRKTRTATTLYDSDGRVVARAEHVWIAVDPAAFG